MATENNANSVYITCLTRMLIPIARFCVRRSIKIHDLLECCKVAMINVAEEQITASSNKVSVSKLSIMTGMHRRDASRIYKEGAKIKTAPSVANKVLGLWQNSSKYTSVEGVPNILSAEGEESKFFQLVRTISGHLNPYTVLFELERTRAVERTPHGLKLIKGQFVPTGDIEEASKMIATDVDDLISSIEENISIEDKVPNLHLVTEYDEIVADAEPAIRQWALEWGNKYHKQAREFLSGFDADVNPDIGHKKGRIRVMLGGFSRITEAQPQT